MKWTRHFLLTLSLVLAAALAPFAASAQALSDYAENKAIDALIRGQALGAPATWHIALTTTACSDSATGTEVAGNNYSRASIAASLAAWAGTQGAGTTTASSGTGGQSSNNTAINFANPSGTWNTVSHMPMMDASSGGNMWVCVPLTVAKTINSGDTVSVPAGALTVTLQ